MGNRSLQCDLGGRMKKLLIVVAVMLAFCLTNGGAAKADDIHLCATLAACAGNPNNVQFVSGGTTNAFLCGKFYPPTPAPPLIIRLSTTAHQTPAPATAAHPFRNTGRIT